MTTAVTPQCGEIACLTAARPADGGLHVIRTDHDASGGLIWFRDLWPEDAGTGSEPRFPTRLFGPVTVARAITDTMSPALSVTVSHDVLAAC